MVAFQDLVSTLSHDRYLRGRQFESICRWFLATDPVFSHQLRQVWLWRDWPGRWGPDAGIDLVAEAASGELWAVQAKAYATSASVTKADLDTFLSESSRPQFALRLLLATTDHLSPNARRTIEAQEKPVRVVMASELAKAALEWPQHPDDLRAAPLPRKSPRAYQEAALVDVLAGFEGADRGQLIMACGTGKTMVGLWVWEALAAPTALVVLPSLSLLAQTATEWCANARQPFDFLAVCSDESVTDSDLMVRRANELPFATTTDADQHRRLLCGQPGAEARAVFHLPLDAAHSRGPDAQPRAARPAHRRRSSPLRWEGRWRLLRGAQGQAAPQQPPTVHDRHAALPLSAGDARGPGPGG